MSVARLFLKFAICTPILLWNADFVFAQNPVFHSNPTQAFYETSKKGKDVLLLFCNRTEEDCKEWIVFLNSNDANFLWHFFEACIIYSDDFDGSVWASRYEVNNTPDVRLYPHPDGLFINLTGIEDLLEKYSSQERNIPSTNTNDEIAQTDTLVPESEEKSYTGEDGQNMLSEINIEMPKEEDSISIPNIQIIETPELAKIAPGFYRIEAQRISAPGFSVQIANFGTYAELLHYAERIQEILNVDVITEIVRENDMIRYKVLLGNFPTREQAAALRTELQSIGIEGFVRKTE